MILTTAYLGANIFAEVLYLPQLVKVIRDPESTRGLSLATWLGWTFTSTVSLAYACFGARDWPFALMTGVNLAFLALTSTFILRVRFNARRSLGECR
jgi:uncharacterized protein with PQ loop repeat